MSIKIKKEVAHLAKELYEGSINYREFLAKIPDRIDDFDLLELIDLIEHQPSEVGILGRDNRKYYEEYKEEVLKLINKMLEE